MDFGFDILAIMIPIIVVVLFVLLFVFGYVSAKPNEAIVITGLGKPRTLIGRSGFMIPFIENAPISLLSSFQQMCRPQILYRLLILST